MSDTVLKIALAALMHDVGKFAQGSLDVTKEYLANNEGQYQPQWDGRHTHVHATYTAAFVEMMADRLPEVCNSSGWGEGDSFINLAAGHHNPETPMQWLIAVGDRISSGLDRATFEAGEKIAFQNFKKTRLLPILESLGHKRSGKFKAASDYNYRYPLAPLSANSIFAGKPENEKSKADANKDYHLLFDDFTEKLSNLLNLNSNIGLWSQHFDSLFMTYTSMIPAARVNDIIHDVSLYDHSRMTAAFASALYLYHNNHISLNQKSIQDNSQEKFLLVTGDFYGIQDFIFSAGGELNKYRSKILRGRSFAVSLFSEIAADMLCRRIGLSHLSVILNAAGKFTILAPNTSEAIKEICEVEKDINNWLYKISYGQSNLGITYTPAAPAEFINGKFSSLWNGKHLPNMDEKKCKKIDLSIYGGVICDYLDQFDNTLDKPLCPLCGKRPSHKNARTGDLVSCRICRDHIMLGTFLVKGDRLAIFPVTTKLEKDKSLLEPIFDKYQLTFTSKTDDNALKLFELQVGKNGSLPSCATARLINGHVPVYSEYDKQDSRLQDDGQTIHSGDPITFNHIAAKAKDFIDNDKMRGVAALGILKADIDNLGILMSTGLEDNLFTISRLATISRQINNFFTIYLPNLLQTSEKFNNIYTVFAGGDDLFLIGPWRVMSDLALEIRNQFTNYVCGNDQITFSAGISIQKTHVPVDKLAEAAEEALSESKDMEGKNSISMFGATVGWTDFAGLVSHKKIMEGWLTDKLIAKAMMYRFNLLVELANQEKFLNEGKVSLEDMECLKWRSKFQYSVARNINARIKGDERRQAIEQVSEMANWLNIHGGAVRIPLWQLLYEQR